MANTIRTPRQGITASSRRIAQAVDDQEWQEFRVSLKGQSTWRKLSRLFAYWSTNDPLECKDDGKDCDVCIRVDNYIKALCRGGQLHPGESLETALLVNFSLDVRTHK